MIDRGEPRRISVFSTLRAYLGETWGGARSSVSAAWAILPYLFSAGEQHKKVTEEYPDPVSSRTADDLPPRTRGLLYNEVDRCTGCGDCVQVCPTQCIKLETELGADQTKIWIATFDIDFSKCIFCGLCVEVCAPQSLTHTKQFEGAVFDRKDLVTSFGRGHVTREQREKWARMRQAREQEEASY